MGVFAFGAVIGSFLNVVIARYGAETLKGRSKCPFCNTQLRWWELIPILSFIFLRRKCRHCRQKISWQYPLVELATATLFLLIYNLQFTTYNLIILWAIFSILSVIVVYDIKHKIIPDALVFIFIGLSFLSLAGNAGVLSGNWGDFFRSGDFWAGPILAFPFAFLWFISKGKWIGLGDAKLTFGIGWFLGLVKGSSAVILAIWIGAVVGLVLVLASKFYAQKQLSFAGKNFTIKSELPFAPFLILGALLVFFASWNVWDLSVLIF